MTIAEETGLGLGGNKALTHGVDDDEVIAEAVHFGEFEFHADKPLPQGAEKILKRLRLRGRKSSVAPALGAGDGGWAIHLSARIVGMRLLMPTILGRVWCSDS